MAFRRQQKATPKDGIHTAIDSFARILGKSRGNPPRVDPVHRAQVLRI